MKYNKKYKIIIYFCLTLIIIIGALQIFISWKDYNILLWRVLINFVYDSNMLYLLSTDNISIIFLLLAFIFIKLLL